MLRFFRTIFISLLLCSWPGKYQVAHASSPWWAAAGQGFYITIGNMIATCSVGFPGWDNHNNHYFITAGHCFRDDNGMHYQYRNGTRLNVYSPNSSRPVGWEYLAPPSGSPYIDISVVKMYPNRKLNSFGWPNITTWPHVGRVGGDACLMGSRYRQPRCGKIIQVNMLERLSGRGWGTMVVDATNICAWHGDSGGAIIDPQGALGILTTGNPHGNTCRVGHGSSQFVPILDVLAYIRKSIPSFRIN